MLLRAPKTKGLEPTRSTQRRVGRVGRRQACVLPRSSARSPSNTQASLPSRSIIKQSANGLGGRHLALPRTAPLSVHLPRRWYAAGSVKAQQILFPALSPTMTTGKLVKWLIKEGDKFKAGDALFEVETDKATVSFESQEAGILAKILIQSGSGDIEVNTLTALFVEPGQDWKAAEVPKAATPKLSTTPAPSSAPASAAALTGSHHAPPQTGLFPSVRRLAFEFNVDLSKIKATGPKNRILKGDILNFIQTNSLIRAPKAPPPVQAAPVDTTSKPSAPSKPAGVPSGNGFEDIPTTNMRRVISDRLTKSKTQVPHAYSCRECTIDKLLELRKQANATLETKLSVNDFLIKASALALRDVPEANSMWNEKTQQITPNASIDVSVAVALESGLITPIIKSANQKGLSAIGTEMKDLAARARVNKLQLHEFQGGSFSLSNLGMFGISHFSAVINPPQAMILAVGGSQSKVVAEPKGLRTTTTISVTLSYDARVVTDDTAARWLDAFEKYLSSPQQMLL